MLLQKILKTTKIKTSLAKEAQSKFT